MIRILRDPSNSFRARVAAVQALLDDVTDDKIVDLMGTVLSSETNNQVKHYITSALMTIASSKNPCTSPLYSFLIQFIFWSTSFILFLYSQGKAKHVLHSVYGANLPGQSSSNSAEYAFDFFENEASFGSQLNLRTTTSEFDDLFGFVSGKMLYFIKGVAVQPFSVCSRSCFFHSLSLTFPYLKVYRQNVRSEKIPLKFLQFLAKKRGLTLLQNTELNGRLQFRSEKRIRIRS